MNWFVPGDLKACLDDARAWGVPSLLRNASPGGPLTDREQEVLQWLGRGKCDKDIGVILGISPRTVHKHLQRIYQKMGVENRTAAVVRATRFAAGNP